MSGTLRSKPLTRLLMERKAQSNRSKIVGTESKPCLIALKTCQAYGSLWESVSLERVEIIPLVKILSSMGQHAAALPTTDGN